MKKFKEILGLNDGSLTNAFIASASVFSLTTLAQVLFRQNIDLYEIAQISCELSALAGGAVEYMGARKRKKHKEALAQKETCTENTNREVFKKMASNQDCALCEIPDPPIKITRRKAKNIKTIAFLPHRLANTDYTPLNAA